MRLIEDEKLLRPVSVSVLETSTHALWYRKHSCGCLIVRVDVSAIRKMKRTAVLEVDLVSRERLYELVWSMPMTKVAERFSVSGSHMARVFGSSSSTPGARLLGVR